MGFEFEEFARLGVVESLVEIFGGTFEFFEEGVEVGEGGFEVGEEFLGLDAEVFGVGESQGCVHDWLLLKVDLMTTARW